MTGYSTFRGRSFRPGERVYAPGVIQQLSRLGVPITGFGPKRDSYSGEVGSGYSPRLDTLLLGAESQARDPEGRDGPVGRGPEPYPAANGRRARGWSRGRL